VPCVNKFTLHPLIRSPRYDIDGFNKFIAIVFCVVIEAHRDSNDTGGGGRGRRGRRAGAQNVAIFLDDRAMNVFCAEDGHDSLGRTIAQNTTRALCGSSGAKPMASAFWWNLTKQKYEKVISVCSLFAYL